MTAAYRIRGARVVVKLYRAARLDDAAAAQDPASPLWGDYAAARRGAAAAAGGRVATMQFGVTLADVEERVIPAVARGESVAIGISTLTGFMVVDVRVDADDAAQMRRDVVMLEALSLAERAPAIAALNAGRLGDLNKRFRRQRRLRSEERAAAAAGCRPDCALVARVPRAPRAPPVDAPLSNVERAEVIRRCAASGVLSIQITPELLKANGKGHEGNTPLARAAKQGLHDVLCAAVAATSPRKQALKLAEFYGTSLNIATPVAHNLLRRALHREVDPLSLVRVIRP